ncbi:unnamed protein product [Heterobilharzia americana]|nr:unnamed protein product [Heterobilharzia americana]
MSSPVDIIPHKSEDLFRDTHSQEPTNFVISKLSSNCLGVDSNVASESSVSSKDPETCPSCVPQPIPPDLPIYRSYGIRSAVGISLLLISAYVGSIFLHGPLLPLSVLSPTVFRCLVDLFLTSWLMFAEFVICKIFGCRVRQFGDRVLPSTSCEPRSCLFLLNHRTQLDWFFVWGLGNPIQRMKIILKDSLAKIPGAGWSMQCGSFIFLRRRIATDQERLRKTISYLLKLQDSCQLLIFPEGTNLTKGSIARSDAFAEKNNLPYLRYTLHPRSTGFLHLVKLIGLDHLTDIYDVTVAYPDILPSPEINLLYGHVPREVHYYVRRFPVKELLHEHESRKLDDDTNNALSKWLQDRWFEKENLLKAYYAKPIGQRSFDNEISPDSLLFCVNTSDNKLTFTYLVYIYFTYYADGVNIWATGWINNSKDKEDNSVITSTTTNINDNGFAHSVHSEDFDQKKKET